MTNSMKLTKSTNGTRKVHVSYIRYTSQQNREKNYYQYGYYIKYR